ncbi:rna-directed dna polymerase from mobile element jockey-like [Willisornis vidua]|uniref:Rna-directed dna polymerase from mobile element jockey-like n=1 Tax=Willisornis vidua TaxID=1566151 RepID=A0ABQ9DF18_9PASS|nr:rna-directed dna polymerase from mobile element jockey-like [Willisornis vidua]
MDKKLVGQSHPEGSDKSLRVLMDISDKSCPSGVCIGTRVLFNIFTNDTDEGTCKFADDIKLSGAVDTPDPIQRDLDKLKKWACGNVMKFNKTRCNVLHMAQGNPLYQYRLGDEQMESSPVKKDLGWMRGWT